MVGCFEQDDECYGSRKCRDYLDWLRKEQLQRNVSVARNLGEIIIKSIECTLRFLYRGIAIVFPAGTQSFHRTKSRPCRRSTQSSVLWTYGKFT